jgi:hypothetical protein
MVTQCPLRPVRLRLARDLRGLTKKQTRLCIAAALRALRRLDNGADIYFLPFVAGGARYALSARRRPGHDLLLVDIAALCSRVPRRLITEDEARRAAARVHKSTPSPAQRGRVGEGARRH